ncbi:MAG: HTH domain-containing protein [Chloroflexi bacterium]|nr:HTH domain-containing protein [Chloroflexota bacterium]
MTRIDGEQDLPGLGFRFQEQARSELERLQEQMGSLDSELARLQEERERVATAVDHLRGLLNLGTQNARVAGGPPAAARPSRSRRAEDAELVVEYLQETGQPAHYREIYRALAEQGLVVGGKDPANTLLARYFNDSRLERVARGTYALKS